MRLLGRTLHPRLFARELRFAAGVLLGRDEPLGRLLASMADDPELAPLIDRARAEMPQALTADPTLVGRDQRDVRTAFGARLAGRGLEIGALHDPVPVPAGVEVEYVDRHDFEGLRREYAPLAGRDFVTPSRIDDGESLATLPDSSRDFVIASHLIEHLRNPIGALRNWCRVTRPGGLIYLAVPDKRLTFDRARVRTTLEHLILDDRDPSVSRDFEHFLDYAIHVHKAEGLAAIAEARRLAEADFSIHYHVFMPADAVRLIQWVSANVTPLDIVEGPAAPPGDVGFHMLLRVGTRGAGGEG